MRKLIFYLLLAFVAFDEPSNLPRLELGRLLAPETTHEESLTPEVTELKTSRSRVNPVKPPAQFHDRRLVIVQDRVVQTTSALPIPSTHEGKGCALLLTC